jgi:dUTP pyrophosphatase
MSHLQEVCRVQIVRLDSGMPMLSLARQGDAGVDLRATESVTLEPGERRMIPTGIAVAIPDGYAGFVQPRSGMAINRGLGLLNSPGLIDSGYRGEIKVIAINMDSGRLEIARGDRIAQLVIMPVPPVTYEEVDRLPESDRGEAGFGSTGTG